MERKIYTLIPSHKIISTHIDSFHKKILKKIFLEYKIELLTKSQNFQQIIKLSTFYLKFLFKTAFPNFILNLIIEIQL